jgi:hypothetical protein
MKWGLPIEEVSEAINRFAAQHQFDPIVPTTLTIATALADEPQRIPTATLVFARCGFEFDEDPQLQLELELGE